MRKKKTPEQQIQEWSEGIRDSIRRWKDTNENGCNDPSWPDGMNMNLLRNHIIYYRYQIKECCEENGIMLPEEMRLACPPIVNDYYMARLDQENRLRNIGKPEKITTEKMPYDEYQNV